MQELEPRAGAELDRLIERYARVRLDPKPSQTRRARAAVMEEAWRRRLAPDLVAAADAGATPHAPRRRGPFAAWGGRRIGASMAAAVLAGLLVGSTAFAASRAGGPLYEPRLSLEALTLPSDPTQRLDAELARAQTRIAEIAEAASRGDDGAIDAAVRAYAQTLGDIDASTGESAGRARDAVILHQAVLRNLLLRVPIQAQSGIERAISNSSVAIDVLDKASAKPAATPLGPANGNPNAGGGNPNAGGWRAQRRRWRARRGWWRPERWGRERRRQPERWRRERRRRQRRRQPERWRRERRRQWGRRQRRRGEDAQARRDQGTPRPGPGPERLTATTRHDPSWGVRPAARRHLPTAPAARDYPRPMTEPACA